MKIEDSKIHEKHDVRTEEIFDTVGMLPHRYVYLLTNRCNLACDFCFQDTSKPEITMTAEDWINVTDQLPPNSRVTLTGGEPLLFPEFEKVFKYVAERFECNMITNGICPGTIKIQINRNRFTGMGTGPSDIVGCAQLPGLTSIG